MLLETLRGCSGRGDDEIEQQVKKLLQQQSQGFTHIALVAKKRPKGLEQVFKGVTMIQRENSSAELLGKAQSTREEVQMVAGTSDTQVEMSPTAKGGHQTGKLAQEK